MAMIESSSVHSAEPGAVRRTAPLTDSVRRIRPVGPVKDTGSNPWRYVSDNSAACSRINPIGTSSTIAARQGNERLD